MKYIAVIHGWHVSSNGFNVHELRAKNIDDAHDEAKALTYSRQGTFDTCAYKIIEIANTKSYIKTLDHKIKNIPLWIRKLFNAV